MANTNPPAVCNYRHLNCEIIDGVLVVTFLDARIRTDEETELIRVELLAAQAEFKPTKAIIDLKNVQTISSRGLGALLAFRSAFLKDSGEVIALCGASEFVADSLSCMRFSEKGTTAPAVDPRPAPTGATGPRPIFGVLEPDVAAALARLR